MADAADSLTTLLDGRHSCRAFLPRRVPRATIERVLRMAQRTPRAAVAQAVDWVED